MIEEAVKEALSNGFGRGAVSNKEAQLAEILKERFESIDYVSFCNSGTEANTLRSSPPDYTTTACKATLGYVPT